MSGAISYTRRALLLTGIAVLGAAIYVLNFGLWPRYFDIEWDEEVQLHDGRVIVVHIKRTFERLGRFARWDGIYRDTEIAFDAGPPWGTYRRKFERYQVNMIEASGGNWYLSMGVTSGTPPRKVVDPMYPRLILRSDGTERAAISWEELPDFPRHNVMPLTPSPEAVLPFANSRLTLQTKMEHWRRFPRAAGDDGLLIQRHEINQGERK